jgi:hypothetical protein|tara:strand:- start:98 stop:655 length:558 start_codon:yes stop_codon:yes gene_type:complete
MDLFVPHVNCTADPEWANLKTQIEKSVEKFKSEHPDDAQDKDGIITDYHYNVKNKITPEYKEIVYKAITNAVMWTARGFDKDYRRLKIKDLWFQETSGPVYHPAHTHGPLGLSGVLYVNYDPEIHKGTRLISPQLHPFDGTHIDEEPWVEEGNALIFPSYLMHEQLPSFSDKKRLIVAFNLHYEE